MAGRIGVKHRKFDRGERESGKDAPFGQEQMAALGRELRRLRLDRGWSLPRMATESGVSVAGIQKIERGLTNPSLQTAFSLSEALGQPLPDLVAAARTAKPPVVAASGRIQRTGHGFAELAGELPQRRLRSRLAVVAPRSSLEAGEMATPVFFYAVRGRLQMHFEGGRSELLGPGDALHIAEEPLRLLENASAQRAVLLYVSDMRGRAG